MRSAPISHALPLDSVASRKASAASSPRTFPHPISVTAPPGATMPPYTVKTAFTASRNPPRPVTAPVGRLGTYYISQTLLLPKIRVGNAIVYDFEASNLPVHTLCTLGNDFLSCFRVTVDFPHRQMFLEREVDRPYHLQGWVGVGLKPDGNDFRVRALEPGSPAAAAGLQTGDKILSVDGHPLQGLSVEAAKTLRDDPAGTRTTFLLQRGTSEPFSLPFITGSLFDAPPDIESGLVVEKPDGQPITIMQVDAGFAAQRAGLVAGDTIIAVDGVPSKSLSFDQTNDAFNKDSLTLTVRRAGESKPRVIVLAK